MLSPQQRHELLMQLARVTHNSITGLAIRNVVSNWLHKSDAEIIQLMSDLQSQIDDNPPLMEQILGPVYPFVNSWRREPETLNLQEHTKRLVQKAIERYPQRTEQAQALGISTRTLNNYLKQFSFIK